MLRANLLRLAQRNPAIRPYIKSAMLDIPKKAKNPAQEALDHVNGALESLGALESMANMKQLMSLPPEVQRKLRKLLNECRDVASGINAKLGM